MAVNCRAIHHVSLILWIIDKFLAWKKTLTPNNKTMKPYGDIQLGFIPIRAFLRDVCSYAIKCSV